MHILCRLSCQQFTSSWIRLFNLIEQISQSVKRDKCNFVDQALPALKVMLRAGKVAQGLKSLHLSMQKARCDGAYLESQFSKLERGGFQSLASQLV